ncbi:MAG TPA: iduronate sulfatase, partial [Verrucomicrobiales bacterium]|nr:iduronate sulfatase [Verrucomicrobiales bacterium]
MKRLPLNLIFFLLCSTLSAQARQPNVLFLAVDDMNDWLGCMDTSPSAITPNLDKLAE